MKNLIYTLALVIIGITSSNAQEPVKRKFESQEDKRIEQIKPSEKVKGFELRKSEFRHERNRRIQSLERKRRIEHQHKIHRKQRGNRRFESRKFKGSRARERFEGNRLEGVGARGPIQGKRLEGDDRRENIVVEGRKIEGGNRFESQGARGPIQGRRLEGDNRRENIVVEGRKIEGGNRFESQGARGPIQGRRLEGDNRRENIVVEGRKIEEGNRFESQGARGPIQGRRLERDNRVEGKRFQGDNRFESRDARGPIQGRRFHENNALTADQRAEKAATAMQKRLNLTDEQKQEIQAIELSGIKKNEEWRLQDEKAMNNKMEQRRAFMTEFREKKEKILTEEQRKMLGNGQSGPDRRADRTPPPPPPAPAKS